MSLSEICVWLARLPRDRTVANGVFEEWGRYGADERDYAHGAVTGLLNFIWLANQLKVMEAC